MKKNWIKATIVSFVTLFGSMSCGWAQTDFNVIVNESVTASSLDKTAIKDIYLGKTAYWEGGQAVIIMVLTDKTDAALQEISGMSASQFKTHWQRLTFSGRGKQPKEIDSAEKIVALVASTKGAVALVPAGTPLQGVKKVEIQK